MLMTLYLKNLKSLINRYLAPSGLIPSLVSGFVMNIFINAGIGIGIFIANRLQPLPLYGAISISGDLIGMSFTLTLLVSWFNIDSARAEIKKNPQKHISHPNLFLRAMDLLLPNNRIFRVLFLSSIFTLPCFPLIQTLESQGITLMTGIEFILFKSLYSGILAALVILASSYSVYLKKN